MNVCPSITPEQWARIARALEGSFGSVELEVDGYALSLQVRRVEVRKFAICVFVNGWMKGSWSQTDCEERRRFFRPVVLRLWSHAKKQKILARASKRAAATISKGLDLDATLTHYTPIWGSFRSLRRHLIENNNSLRLVSIDGLGEPEAGATTAEAQS